MIEITCIWSSSRSRYHEATACPASWVGDLDLLLLVVLDGLLEPDLVGQLGRPDVLPAERVPAVLQGEDERLVDDVLDVGWRVPDRGLGELLEIYVLVAHLVQVVVRYVLATL